MRKLTCMFAAVAAASGLTMAAASAQDTTKPAFSPPPRQSAAGTVKPGQTGDEAEKQANKDQLYEVDDLVGAKIRNAKGDDLGEVEEMVVDVNDGSIRYAVVSYGGFLDLGDKLFAVPLKAMSLRRNEDNKIFFVVDIDEQQLKKSTGFDDDNWPNFADPKFAAAAHKTYNVTPDESASGRHGALYKLSTFDGVNVRGQGNKEIGEVERILVDADHAKVAYLALDLKDDLKQQKNDDALALVPMEQFTLKTQDDDTFLQMTGDADKLANAPMATKDELDDAAKHQQLRQKIDSHWGQNKKAAKNASSDDANNDQENK